MILFYDTETTGFVETKLPGEHPDQPRIVQIAAILDHDDGREAMRLDLILRHEDLSDRVVSGWEKASAIHGITKEVADRIGVTEVLAVEAFMDMVMVADIVVGHNILGYDNKVVTNTCRRVFKDPALLPFDAKANFDTMQAAKPVVKLPSKQGGFRSPSLTDTHQKLFGEGFDGAHAAINDVLACRRVFYKLQELIRQ